MTVLQARQLSVALAGKTVVEDLDLTLSAGEITVLLGPNGAGKSTLLGGLAGELPITGELNFGGRPMTAWAPGALARQRGVMPQRVEVNFPLTVEEVVRLGRTGGDRRADEAILAEVLSALSLEGLRYRKMPTLSGGEQQRVQLARVLAQILDSQGPRLLLLDECTSALDPAHQQLALGLVRTLARTQGIAVLAIVHDLNLAAQFADRLVVLKAGRCVASGPAEEVLTPSMLASVYGYQARVERLAEGYSVIVPVAGAVQTAPVKPTCRQAS
ncbi:heme ABC transporter ATP-binding protein [Marinobacter lutaoensis]|uniref:Heme ABC transporter ATP-binding protein n=1 Tax=Marinobacter lutaoensis TaxID=135739 RepID=A0A1V2DR38_9GAMM|nr:heme ABC transporter ATP-binding protein [Marinobacter lutaoensis]ONF43165.1 heme ABC transporter ATP-binding protein [Marinobacter lutaoensis]